MVDGWLRNNIFAAGRTNRGRLNEGRLSKRFEKLSGRVFMVQKLWLYGIVWYIDVRVGTFVFFVFALAGELVSPGVVPLFILSSLVTTVSCCLKSPL